MARDIEWLGIKLPSSHPVLSDMMLHLSKVEREAIYAVEEAGVPMVAIAGTTAFRVGPPQGFSKWYEWNGAENYIQSMADSDAAHLFRGGITEFEMFRDLGYPPHRNKRATYPSEMMMKRFRFRDHRTKKLRTVTPEQARIVSRLLRMANTEKPLTVTKTETGKPGRPGVASSLLMAKHRRR